MMRARATLCALLMGIIVIGPTYAEQARVIGITDGDSITVLTADKQQIKVRLAHIDAPEKGQAFGNASKKALSAMCFGKEVSLNVTDTDRYGRKVCEVKVGSVDVNLEMIRQGMAWHFKKYSSSKPHAEAEIEARNAKRGIWSDPGVIPPWEYRANGNSAVKREPVNSEDGTPLYWLNTSSNTRHNSRCKYFNKTKRGRLATASEGKACGICGG